MEALTLSNVFFFLFFFCCCVCLNYPAQCAYVLMLLLPCCIQWGHIDLQIPPQHSPCPLEIHCITPSSLLSSTPSPDLKCQCKLIQGVCLKTGEVVESHSKNTVWALFLSLTVHVWMYSWWLRSGCFLCACVCVFTEKKLFWISCVWKKKARHCEGKSSCFCCSSVFVR